MTDNPAHLGAGSMKTLLDRLDAEPGGEHAHERRKRPEDRDPLGALRSIDLNVIAAAANDDQSLSGSRNDPNLAELRAFLAQDGPSGGMAGGAAGMAGMAVSGVGAGGGRTADLERGLPDVRDGDLPKVVASGGAIASEPAGEAGMRSDGRSASISNPIAVHAGTATRGMLYRPHGLTKLAVAISLPLCLVLAYVAAGWFATVDASGARDVPVGAGSIAVGGLAAASSDGFDLSAVLPSLNAALPIASKTDGEAGGIAGQEKTAGQVGGGTGADSAPINSSYVTDASGQRRILIEAVAGENIALPLELGPASATAEVGALVVRGLPESFAITGASAAGDGSWVLAPQELPTARIAVPAQAAGELDVGISLFDFAAVEVGQMDLRLKIVAGVSTEASQAVRGIEPERKGELLARGRELLEMGDVASARLLFVRAAEGGDGEAALLVGETYDPVRLAVRGVIGLGGSAETAKDWYQRALSQGVAEAKIPLSMLTAFESRERQTELKP